MPKVAALKVLKSMARSLRVRFQAGVESSLRFLLKPTSLGYRGEQRLRRVAHYIKRKATGIELRCFS